MFGILANPFLIDFPEKSDLTNEDYLTIQGKLRSINIEPLLKELYADTSGLTSFEDLQNRCTRGIRQVLIDPENGFFPIKKLVQIGKGGNKCIVACCPFNGPYPKLIESIPKTLEAEGFNGYFYYRIGGFPNPTGHEIKYAGIPYAFKIFMMLEAEKLGFNHVLWMDSSILVLKDPSPLFDKIEKEGCFLLDFVNHAYNQRYIFPKTRLLLKNETGTDVVECRHISTQIFGLKMDAEKTKRFLSSYRKLLELGTPFLSCFPEEFVFASIFQQSEADWPSQYVHQILQYAQTNDVQTEIQTMKAMGLYFLLRRHESNEIVKN